MSTQLFKKPRFYVCNPLFLIHHKATNLEFAENYGWDNNIVSFNMAKTYKTNQTIVDDPENHTINIPYGTFTSPRLKQDFVFVLGHNMGEFYQDYGTSFSITDATGEATDSLNSVNYGAGYNGWSLNVHTPSAGKCFFNFHNLPDPSLPQVEFSAIIVGKTFDLLHPDIKFTTSYDMSSTKTLTTYNGGTITNTMGYPTSWWRHLAPWQLEMPSWSDAYTLPNDTPILQKLAPKYRRTWSLKFSHLSSSDMWGPNQNITTRSPYTNQQNIDLGYEDGDFQENYEGFDENLLSDMNVFSQIYTKTLNGAIPMIMQIDHTDFSPDNFFLVRIKNDFKAVRKSYNAWDIAFTLEETW